MHFLLADFPWGALIVGVIALFGWLANKVKEAQKPANADGGGQVGQGIQNEIDRFLSEVRGEKPRQRVAANDPDEGLEVNDDPRQRQRPQRREPERRPAEAGQPLAPATRRPVVASAERPRRKPQRQARQKPQEQPRRLPRQKPGEQLEHRHAIGSRSLGSSVETHVEEHLREGRLAEQVDQDLGDGVEQSVTEHLGVFEAERHDPQGPDPLRTITGPELVGLLTRPEGIRQAMLIYEILSPPKGRRGRSRG